MTFASNDYVKKGNYILCIQDFLTTPHKMKQQIVREVKVKKKKKKHKKSK